MMVGYGDTGDELTPGAVGRLGGWNFQPSEDSALWVCCQYPTFDSVFSGVVRLVR